VGTDHYSVAIPRPAWYPACRTKDLGDRRPLAVELDSQPLVLFRDGSGQAGALLDRCPHRNVPLSLGRVEQGALECGYHGWRFDREGGCCAVPGLDETGRRGVAAHAVSEHDGFVWVWSEPDDEPTAEPFRLPDHGPGAREVVLCFDMEATLHAAIENTLDVPHTAFLHRGLLRGAAPNELRAERRSIPGGVEVQYHGEPFGIGFIRAKGGKELEHYDRFLLPCVAQVEYRAEPWLHLTNSVIHLPMSDFRTRAWFVLRFNSNRLPTRLVQAIVRAQGPHVAKQDVRLLGEQTRHIQRFGGEHYSSTDMDLFGNAVWRLLRHAAGARDEPPDIREKSVTFRA
jgi:phenylpropionate dioxygenase-like ring-hydroxylating dioxygenase large terminal subunit